MSVATTPATDQVRPPSVERSTEIESEVNFCLGRAVISVVVTAPSGVTFGSRNVAPCGVAGDWGSGIGSDHAVCVPSGRASANATTGLGPTPVKMTHIAYTRPKCGLTGLVSIVIHCLSGSRPLAGYVATKSGWPSTVVFHCV